MRRGIVSGYFCSIRKSDHEMQFDLKSASRNERGMDEREKCQTMKKRLPLGTNQMRSVRG